MSIHTQLRTTPRLETVPPYSALLHDDFWEAYWDLLDAANAGATTVDEVTASAALVHRELAAFHQLLTAALEPILGPNAIGSEPTAADIEAYVAKGPANSKRLDCSIRLFTGSWNKDIKLVVDLVPWGIQVLLTSWMSNKETSGEFGRFWRSPAGATARQQLSECSSQLERTYGVALHHQHSIRDGSFSPHVDGWIDHDDDWWAWQQNRVNQASVGLWLTGTQPLEVLVEQDRQTAARMLGGLEGHQLSEARTDDTALEAAIAAGIEQRAATHESLVEQGMLAPMAVEAAKGLALPLKAFQDYAASNALPTFEDTDFDTDPPELIAKHLRSYAEAQSGAHSAAFSVRATDDGATLGWSDDRGPWIDVRRDLEGLHFTLRADEVVGRYPTQLRKRLHGALYRHGRDALVDLMVGSGGSIVAQCDAPACRKRGHCVINTDLPAHLFLHVERVPKERKALATLEWSLASDGGGGGSTWLEKPAQLMVSLLLQAASPPPLLTLPRLTHERWDVFISTPGAKGGTPINDGSLSAVPGPGVVGQVGRDIESAIKRSKKSVWHMDHHHDLGGDVNEKTLAGVKGSSHMVVVLHEAYLASEYCLAEYREAKKRGMPITPVLLTGTSDFSPAVVIELKASALAFIASRAGSSAMSAEHAATARACVEEFYDPDTLVAWIAQERKATRAAKQQQLKSIPRAITASAKKRAL